MHMFKSRSCSLQIIMFLHDSYGGPSGMPGGGVGIEMDDNVPRRLRSEGRSKDVFAMVKAAMSDQVLSQPPILVYPHSYLPATQSLVNRINSTTLTMNASLDESRSEELSDLANNIEQDFPHLQRGANYLRSLVNSERARQPFPVLNFIEAGPSASSNLHEFRLGNRVLPPKPYKLQVVYRHALAN